MRTERFVSVCIPTRNGAERLRHTLRNLERSSVGPESFEVVVGNHGSTDGTAELLAAARERTPNVRSLNIPYDGPNRARVRNHLIRESRGSLIIFIDDDVLVPPEFVAEHSAVHDAHPSALVGGKTYGKSAFRPPRHATEGVEVARRNEARVATLDLDDIGAHEATLASILELRDERTADYLLGSSGGVRLLNDEYVPSRFLWTCNLSAQRADISECGGFDEAYTGWGLEDDDFAQQFLRKGKRLLFAHRPWAFHIPHPSNPFRNKLEWRRNYEHFFRKFADRELESHAVFKWPDAGRWRIDSALAALSHVGWSGVPEAVHRALSPCGGRRLCHFIRDAPIAKRLGVTDAFNPWMPSRAPSEARDGVVFWPFFGMHTPFDPGTFDQALVIVDLAMVLDRHLQVLLLAESVRTSRSIVFCCGDLARDAHNRFLVDSFREVVAGVRLPERSVLLGEELAQGAAADAWLGDNLAHHRA